MGRLFTLIFISAFLVIAPLLLSALNNNESIPVSGSAHNPLEASFADAFFILITLLVSFAGRKLYMKRNILK